MMTSIDQDLITACYGWLADDDLPPLYRKVIIAARTNGVLVGRLAQLRAIGNDLEMCAHELATDAKKQHVAVRMLRAAKRLKAVV